MHFLLELLGVTEKLGRLTNYIAPAIYGTRAILDVYKKEKLGDNGWI